MKIVRSHKTEKVAAIKKIDGFLDALVKRQFPGGVVVKDAQKRWNGDSMTFSFKVKKGFIGATISGVIAVNDEKVILTSQLPGLVTAAVSEDKIVTVIEKQFDELFA